MNLSLLTLPLVSISRSLKTEAAAAPAWLWATLSISSSTARTRSSSTAPICSIWYDSFYRAFSLMFFLPVQTQRQVGRVFYLLAAFSVIHSLKHPNLYHYMCIHRMMEIFLC